MSAMGKKAQQTGNSMFKGQQTQWKKQTGPLSFKNERPLSFSTENFGHSELHLSKSHRNNNVIMYLNVDFCCSH